MHLARALSPERILLAGLEPAVWKDFPGRMQKIEKITAQTFDEFSAGIGKSSGADVTGGMESKVKQMLELVQQNPELTIQIFSGIEPGNIVRALTGETLGTVIEA
jgi:isopentenyl phosphate kinase